ncbi:MAG: ABC transporter ATP-binding protein, partial [Firmicutes bacterium]|nr:ABC transporter ATP-binding protein [Bacillota bacterium]
KSVTALSIMQLIRRPRGQIVDGKITYYKQSGEVIDITKLHPQSTQMRNIRGNEISMIFQEPMTALNPVYTVGDQIIEAIRLNQKLDKKAAREHAIDMLRKVGISVPERRVDQYPWQFSGGMRQRAMIAMALSCNPELLIADEPTTALDVTIEAQILGLLKDLQRDLSLSIMIITHDLGVIAEMANRVVVMYTGKIAENASTDEIFYNPKHPYTTGLLNSIPRIGRTERLTSIRGSVPNMLALPKGCYFAPRCPEATEICHKQEPGEYEVTSSHSVKCWLYDSVKEVTPA